MEHNISKLEGDVQNINIKLIIEFILIVIVLAAQVFFGISINDNLTTTQDQINQQFNSVNNRIDNIDSIGN